MPQFSSEFFLSQFFWLIVIFACLYALMAWVVLPRMSATIDNRKNKIEGDLAEARRLQAQAQKMRDDYESELAQARTASLAEARKVSDEVARQVASEQVALAERLGKQTQEAEARIRVARDKALKAVPEIATQVAQAMVMKLAGESVSEDRVREVVRAHQVED